jgi:hypothetical protein
MVNNPQVNLETYIIVPFEIVSRHKTEINYDDLENAIKFSDWELQTGYTLDKISTSLIDESHKENIYYQLYNYFHPFVHDYWFNQKQVKRYRHSKLAQLHAIVTYYGTNGKEEKEVKFDAICELLHFTPNIGMLVLHLKHNHLDLKATQACLDQLRRLYPPYLKYDDNDQKLLGGHFPLSVTLRDQCGAQLACFPIENPTDNKEPAKRQCKIDLSIELTKLRIKAEKLAGKYGLEDMAYRPDIPPNNLKKRHSHLWASHWAYLLQPFATEADDKYYNQFFVRQLGDDRAGVVSLISIHTDQNDNITQMIDTGNLKRLCFADEPGIDRTPYSERFLTDERFFSEYCYTRFWYNTEESSDKPSLIMNSGYAFCWLGDANDHSYFTNQKDGAPVTFRHIYVPMAIIAHFQKAFLLTLANRLTDLTPYENGKPDRINMKDFQRMKLDLIAFTQTYWFSEISPQEQGIELFEMWRKKLRLTIIHDDIRQQINDIVEYNNAEAASWTNKQITFLTKWAIFLAIIGLAAGILGMNTFEVQDGKPSLEIVGIYGINLIVEIIIPLTFIALLIFFISYIKKK